VCWLAHDLVGPDDGSHAVVALRKCSLDAVFVDSDSDALRVVAVVDGDELSGPADDAETEDAVPVAGRANVVGVANLEGVHGGRLLVSGGLHAQKIGHIYTSVKSVDTMTGIPYSPRKHGSVG